MRLNRSVECVYACVRVVCMCVFLCACCMQMCVCVLVCVLNACVCACVRGYVRPCLQHSPAPAYSSIEMFVCAAARYPYILRDTRVYSACVRAMACSCAAQALTASMWCVVQLKDEVETLNVQVEEGSGQTNTQNDDVQELMYVMPLVIVPVPRPPPLCLVRTPRPHVLPPTPLHASPLLSYSAVFFSDRRTVCLIRKCVIYCFSCVQTDVFSSPPTMCLANIKAHPPHHLSPPVYIITT